MFKQLQEINARPAAFEHYTAEALWTDEYTSSRMLEYHLDGSVDISSRKTEFIDRSVDFIISRFGLESGKQVADFGCGPGLYTSRLARSGAAVTGIDFSGRSIQYARESARRQELNIEYVQANYLEFESSERFDLITLIMCDFCALCPDRRQKLLDKIKGLLKPGGAVLLDVYSLNAFDKREELCSFAPGLLGGFWSPEAYYGFLNTFKYERELVVLDKYTILEESRTRTIYNWLQYFDRDSLRMEIEARGLVVDQFLADVAGAVFDPGSDEFAVVARRR